MMPETLWTYRARPERIIDGDSIVVTLDLGLGVHIGRGNEGAHLRLLGVDCPERNEAGWDAARQFTAAWMFFPDSSDEWPLRIQTALADSFGRYLATIWRINDQRCLNDDLLSSGMARPYRTGRTS